MRINYLPRTGMVQKAFEYAIKNDKECPYVLADYEKINKTRVYDPSVGTTSKKCEKLCKYVENYLNDNFLMYFLDVTNPHDDGSREEVVLCYRKPKGFEENSCDWIYYAPDFEKELPILVLYR